MVSPQEQHVSTHYVYICCHLMTLITKCSVCTIKIILAFCWSAAYSAKTVAAAAKQDDYPDNAAAAAAKPAEAVAAVTCAAPAAAAAKQ